MGKNQKIPYLNEVLIYFIKATSIYIILSYLLLKTNFYNQPLILTFSIFAAFCLNPIYIFLIGFNYILSFGLTAFPIGDLSLLFLYLFSVLLNTFFMIVYIKIKYKFKEEK